MSSENCTRTLRRQPKKQRAKHKRKQGRPEELVEMDGSPHHVAHARFGIPSDKCARRQGSLRFFSYNDPPKEVPMP